MKNTVKTTIELDKNILYRAKLKALKEEKTLKDIINESLMRQLKVNIKPKKTEKNIIFGGYSLGGVKGSLRRIDLYEDF